MLASWLILAMLAGCATPSSTSNSAADHDVALLTIEQRGLDDWFRGTPVVIALDDDETLRVEVPLAHSFDTGRSHLKPALAAVLDRVATSLRRQPATRVTIAAPGDDAGKTALVTSRIRRIRDHLVASGVARARVSSVGALRAGAPVRLRITVIAQAIERLDDRPMAPRGDRTSTGRRR